MPRKNLSSFPVEFYQAWDLAIADRLDIPFPSKGQATNFVQQMYQFRRLLAKENVEQSNQYYQTDLKVFEESEPSETGVSAPAFHLRAFLPEWKKRVRDLNAGTPNSKPIQVREVVARENSKDSSESLARIPDAVTESLKKLGFSTG